MRTHIRITIWFIVLLALSAGVMAYEFLSYPVLPPPVYRADMISGHEAETFYCCPYLAIWEQGDPINVDSEWRCVPGFYCE